MYVMGDGTSVANDSESAIKRLKKVLDRDFSAKEHEGESDLQTLLNLTKGIKDLNENTSQIETKSGNTYTVSEGTVASTKLFDVGPPDSPENIKGALELAVMAKAVLKEDSGSIGGFKSPQELAVATYAAQLAGVRVSNGNPNIDPAIKQKMDAAWAEMNPTKKIPDMPKEELAADADRKKDTAPGQEKSVPDMPADEPVKTVSAPAVPGAAGPG